ncbi:hypothetical protein LCGC14_1244050 [marine sediment metagenome]|uniref:PLD phosphodiesterase domain-containing protein n=1 Tax=marine sediment metagenome TaxID=412755 RepID=A0A0F9NM99_9ZZZZ
MGLVLTDNNFLPQARALIESAKRSIDISTFKAEITTKPRGLALLHFFKAVLAKAKEGVQIHFLINWNNEKRSCPKTNLYVITELRKVGIDIRHLKNNRCCHAKIIIVDQERAIIGSHNLSVKSCHNNFEISYVMSSNEEVFELKSFFEASFLGAEKYKR